MIIFQFLPRSINQLITENHVINGSAVKVIKRLRWNNIQIAHLCTINHFILFEYYISAPDLSWSER